MNQPIEETLNALQATAPVDVLHYRTTVMLQSKVYDEDEDTYMLVFGDEEWVQDLAGDIDPVTFVRFACPPGEADRFTAGVLYPATFSL